MIRPTGHGPELTLCFPLPSSPSLHLQSTRAQTIFDQFAANQRAAGHSRLEVRRQLKQGLPAAIGLIDADAELARKVADAPKGANKEFDVKFYHDGKPKHPMPGYVEYK